jgi:hypothetical protein
MKKLAASLSVGLYGFLSAWAVSPAADVPDSSASSGPALAAYGDRLVMAWAGAEGTIAHPVWYTLFDGDRTTPEARVPGALTTAAPAVAAVGGVLYLATTSPNSGGEIRLYTATEAGFSTQSAPLCDAVSCARTSAAPALTAIGGTLVAAWTTRDGEIMTALRTGAGWSIEPRPIPNASANPVTGPTLSVFQNKLRIAWVSRSGESVSVSTGTIVPSAAVLATPIIDWSSPIAIAAETKLAPALGVFTVGDSTPGAASELVEAMFIAWTTPDSTVEFARFNPATGQWAGASSPVPLGAAALTSESPAIASFTFHAPNGECLRSDDVGETDKGRPHRVDLRGIPTACP